MQTGETMNGMKKIGAFFAAGLLLVGCAAGKKPAQSASKQQPANLTGTQWTLEEIGGKPVVEHSQATLAFLEAGRVSGHGSCNRFMGPAEMSGDKIKLGPLAGTKMMCDPGASDQENRLPEGIRKRAEVRGQRREAADLRCRLGCATAFSCGSGRREVSKHLLADARTA
jgi:heat shock protein HslJ